MEESDAGYCPWGHKESDMTKRLHFHFEHSWHCLSLGLESTVLPYKIKIKKRTTHLKVLSPHSQEHTGHVQDAGGEHPTSGPGLPLEHVDGLCSWDQHQPSPLVEGQPAGG